MEHVKIDFKSPFVCKKAISSKLNYAYVAGGKTIYLLEQSCHGSSQYAVSAGRSDSHYLNYFPVDKTGYDEPEVKRWTAFVEACGIPCEYMGIQDIKTKSGYNNLYCKCYVIKLECKNFKRPTDMLAALTMVRNLSYQYIHSEKIPELTFEIKRKLGKRISKLQALLLACNHLSQGMGHCMTDKWYKNGNGQCNKGINTKTLLERIKSANYSTVNSLFFEPSKITYGRMSELINAKDFETLIKEL